MRAKLSLIVFILSLLFAARVPAQTKEQRKQAKAEAQALIAEAKTLQSQGKLREAAAKLEEANRKSSLGEGEKLLKTVDKAIVDSLVSDAAKLYEQGNYGEAKSKLEEANKIPPETPRVLIDLAAADVKLGDRKEALDYIARCRALLPENSPEILKLDQMKTAVTTGEEGRELNADSKAATEQVNLTLSAKFDHPDEIKDFRDAEADKEKQKCKALRDNESKLPQTGAVIFNLAKCAQEDGRYEDAQRYFASYIQAAPKSLDLEDVKLRLEDIAPLVALNDAKADQIRTIYTQAYQHILARRYNAAIEDYKQADVLLPSYPQTKYKLGMLYVSMGDVVNAGLYLGQYVAVEDNAQKRAAAQAILNGIAQTRSIYNQRVAEARQELLKGSIRPAMVSLSAAEQVHPLGKDVNSLFAYAYLNGNNVEGARAALDTVWSQGGPVSFYGGVLPEGGKVKSARAAKIEIESNALRIVFLQSLAPRETGKKKKNAPDLMPSAASRLGDGKANLGGSSRDILPANSPDVLTIPVASVKKVQTSDATAVILEVAALSAPELQVLYGPDAAKMSGKEIRFDIFPTVSEFTPPDQGWPARKFANTYTRMFSQYLGYDGVHLGPEHMSSKEKWVLVMIIASVPLSYGASASALPRAMEMAFAAVQAYAIIQGQILNNRRLAQALDFKIIPPTPTGLTFRTDDFK